MENLGQVKNKLGNEFNSDKGYENLNSKKSRNDTNRNISVDMCENENTVSEISNKHEEIIQCTDLKPSMGDIVGNKDQCKSEDLPKFDNIATSDIKKENCNNFDTNSALCKSESIKIESKLNDAVKNTVTVKSENKDVKPNTKRCARSKTTSPIKKIDKIGKNKKNKPSNKKHLKNETHKTTTLAKGSKINVLNEDDSSLSSVFEINIPLIGKNVIVDDSKPFHARYDLAVEINKKRFRHQKKEGFMIPSISFDDWRKERDGKSDAEKKKFATDKKQNDVKMARDITQIGIKILQLLLKDVIDEKRVGRLLIEFLFMPISPTSLLYIPHFVHTIMICRGCKDFGQQLRSLADECYQRCHAMFPLPHGYNFETVYTCQVRKFLPDIPIRLDKLPLDYYDFSESSDSDNTERSDL